MIIGLCREHAAGETRVALTPPNIKTLVEKGQTCLVETGAGLAAGISDEDFKAAGEKGLIWNEETLSGYLNKKPGPKKWLGEFLGKKKAKTKMSFSGIKKDEDLANLIAYLKEATK